MSFLGSVPDFACHWLRPRPHESRYSCNRISFTRIDLPSQETTESTHRNRILWNRSLEWFAGPRPNEYGQQTMRFQTSPDSYREGLMFMTWNQVLFSETPYLTGLSAVFTIERISRGVHMTPGRLSRRREFTPVPSSGPVFVFMVPTQNAIPARVTLAWAHPSCCTGARISLRYEISQG